MRWLILYLFTLCAFAQNQDISDVENQKIQQQEEFQSNDFFIPHQDLNPAEWNSMFEEMQLEQKQEEQSPDLLNKKNNN